MSDNQFLFYNNYDLKINGVVSDVLGGIGISVSGGSGPTATISLSDTSVSPGSYTNTNLTVNQQGQITTISDGITPTVLEITAGTGISVSGGSGPIATISLSDTSVSPGSYTNTNLTVNQQGQITTISDGITPTVLEITAGTGISVSGGSGPTATISLSNTAVTPASYTFTNLTVNAQGQITAASSGTPIISVVGASLQGLKFITSSGNVSGSLEYNGFSVWKTRDQSISTSSSTTALPWTTTNPTSSTVIGYNTGTCLNLTTGVFTCPAPGGLWQFEGRIVWAAALQMHLQELLVLY